MSEQIEIEFKTLLSETNYNHLIAHYQITTSDIKTQVNHYFDTPDQQLRNKRYGLRVRTTALYDELTLKTPVDNGLLETTDRLTKEETAEILRTGRILQTGAVAKRLLTASIDPTAIVPLTSLTTKRAEFPIKEGLLAIDHSWYGDKEDFELELEVTDPISGKDAFLALLTAFEIPYMPAKNKIERAMSEK
ncbi:CYTH domain-containing protein [Candidatus Enterococcus testudinis]|nr:CYTH domain-containing protein [Enterococcus sp. 8G7_MSG3316]